MEIVPPGTCLLRNRYSQKEIFDGQNIGHGRDDGNSDLDLSVRRRGSKQRRRNKWRQRRRRGQRSFRRHRQRSRLAECRLDGRGHGRR
jgi:hypothetical protein